MEAKGSPFSLQFQGVSLPRNTHFTRFNTVVCVVGDSSSTPFRGTFTLACRREKSIEVHCNDGPHGLPQQSVFKSRSPRMPVLACNHLQIGDQESLGTHNRSFGRFVARGVALDEEYWEFYGLKRRCAGRDGNSLKCTCIVTVKEDKNVNCTVLNNVVGTLDLSIRQFLQGETYPGEQKRTSLIFANHEAYEAHKYGYIANLCVSKFARRQGIASNMLYLATDLATLAGMRQLFVHVNADNKPAQDLYTKTGFKMVEAASSPLAKDQRLLMSMQL